MTWIVITEDPRPDKYIPILVRSQQEAIELSVKLNSFQVFNNEDEAISLATQLKEKYRVKSIRIFYSEGYSKNVTI
ncbi:MAG: hypothetical protein MI921_18125 [Cytophagales bacterium]|nr:hypothetical protein [Cytophagales bacterium]